MYTSAFVHKLRGCNSTIEIKRQTQRMSRREKKTTVQRTGTKGKKIRSSSKGEMVEKNVEKKLVEWEYSNMIKAKKNLVCTDVRM